ncbi:MULTISPECIES: hypothetical protein [unclassified Microbacterium]|uniref:hypothetical protein n=1 Tax=unclassified Microbacterium TaxID=2609290 RepID=UPI0037462D01
MSDRSDLPEGVINADPPGGFESADAVDGETLEQNEDAAGSGLLADSGFPSEGGEAPSDPIEAPDAGQGSDPDSGIPEES